MENTSQMTIHSLVSCHKTLARLKDAKAMNFIQTKIQGNQNS